MSYLSQALTTWVVAIASMIFRLTDFVFRQPGGNHIWGRHTCKARRMICFFCFFSRRIGRVFFWMLAVSRDGMIIPWTPFLRVGWRQVPPRSMSTLRWDNQRRLLLWKDAGGTIENTPKSCSWHLQKTNSWKPKTKVWFRCFSLSKWSVFLVFIAVPCRRCGFVETQSSHVASRVGRC